MVVFYTIVSIVPEKNLIYAYDRHFIHLIIYILKEILYLPIEPVCNKDE